MKESIYYIAYSFIENQDSANQIQSKKTFESLASVDSGIKGIFLGNKGSYKNPFWKVRKKNNQYFIDRFDFVNPYIEKIFKIGLIRKNIFPYLFAKRCQSIIGKDIFPKTIYMRLTSPEEAICYIRNLDKLNVTRIFFEMHNLNYEISHFYKWGFEKAYCKSIYEYFFGLVRKSSGRIRIISLTGKLADIINSRFNIEKIETVSSAHDFYAGQPKNVDFNKKRIEIIYVGLSFQYREVETLIQALNYLSDKFYIRAVGGRVSERAAFARKYYSLIQQERLIMEEPIGHDRIKEKLLNADIAVLTSPSKGFGYFTSPLKLFEYMSVGLPIIASDTACLREILTKESALFFKTGKSRDLANKIEYIAENETEARRIGERAFRESKKYTYSQRAKKIHQLISR